jgi:hypothetical protein
MGKFKPVKVKAKSRPVPQGGLPCVILVIVGMFLVGIFLYLAMKNTNAIG